MKKLDFKALFVNHVEKMVLGLVGLTVLIVWAKTSWDRYPKTPDAMKQKAKEIRDKVSAETNVWPLKEQEAFKVVDFNEKARQLFAPAAPIALARYSFTPPLFYPLYRKDEPRREPTLEAPQYLIAKFGLAPLSMINPEAQQGLLDSSRVAAIEEPKADMPEAEDEFSVRKDPVAGGAGAVGPNGFSRPTQPPPGMRPPTQPGMRGGPPIPSQGVRPFGMPPGGSKDEPEIKEIPSVKALGVRYVAVRAVFPLAQQITNYRNALKMSQNEAQSKLDITGFVLERQKAVDAADRWDENLSPWEVVKVDMTIEILNECSGFDSNDPVPLNLQDADITMPLPERLLGVWGEAATHPKIKDQELTEAGIEIQNSILDSIDAALNQTHTQEVDKKKGKGFSAIQRDVKSMVSSVKSAAGAMDAYKSQMEDMKNRMRPQGGMPGMSGMPPGGMGPGGMGAGGMGAGGMRGFQDLDRLVAVSKYILFRCFDFDVESGFAYRYRVRLIVNNPNFELPPEELAGADPDIANGETRETPWSNISNPVVVDNTFNYFLKDVERDPYRDEKVKSLDIKPVAQLNIFDWDTSLGTLVKDPFNVPALGSFIGGIAGIGTKRESTVLDLVKKVIDKKPNRKFASMDVLVDVEPDMEIPTDLHTDLKLNGNKGVAKLHLNEVALVATGTGELKKLDPIADRHSEEIWDDRLKRERRNFSEAAKTTSKKNGLDALTGAMEEEDKSSKNKKAGKGRNALKKAADAIPSFGGGMPPTRPQNRKGVD